MSKTTIKKNILKEFDKKFKDFFTTEYIVCGNCGHSKESHWWNGGGRTENSGYDACHVKGCKCDGCVNEKVCKDVDKKNMNLFKDFISKSLDAILKEDK